MNLHAKIGTMPGTYVRVRYKRNPPKVGDRLEVRDMNDDYRSGWMSVVVAEILDHAGVPFYKLDRM